MFNLAINWDVNPEIIEGFKTPNWYGLLFVSGLILGYFLIKKVFQKEQIGEEKLDKLVLYMVLATVVGARLGHVLFYGPYFDKITPEGLVIERGYFSHPLDIIKIWEGGLASHGAAIAIAIALWFFSRKIIMKPYLWILDRMAASLAVGAAFIRLGNLANSEIVGNVTTVPWGFRFMRNDCYPPFDCSWNDIPVRHPAQLYESISYFVLFALLLYFFWKLQLWKKEGFLFGFYLMFTFIARFLIEFVKIGQTERDDYLAINTGQMLSIPFVLLGGWVLFRAVRRNS
jgi:phosphatidylglycerol:prolipoprotein diacylglycerol transferase